MLSLIQVSGTVAVITSDGRMIVVSIKHIHSLLVSLLVVNFYVKLLISNV